MPGRVEPPPAKGAKDENIPRLYNAHFTRNYIAYGDCLTSLVGLVNDP